MTSTQPEVWLRGAVPGVPSLLQPVAHALLQVEEDLPPLLAELTEEQMWTRPGHSAPIGFHAFHLAGSLDRLFTYARGQALSPSQVQAMTAERGIADSRPSAPSLVTLVSGTLERAVRELGSIPEESLLDERRVGRKQLPSTRLGLLFHAAEHTTRHAGQIATLHRVIR